MRSITSFYVSHFVLKSILRVRETLLVSSVNQKTPGSEMSSGKSVISVQSWKLSLLPSWGYSRGIENLWWMVWFGNIRHQANNDGS